MPRPLDRRDFLVMSSAAFAAQWGFAGPATASTITIPVIDRLSVKVLTDSSYDTPRASASKWVKVRRAGLSAAGDYRKTLHNEWGLALALESQAGAETRNLLLDFGYTTDALVNNLEIMSVDLAKVQGLILSHGHFDHYGGLIGLVQRYRSRLPAELALYAGGEDNFCRRVIAGSAPGQFAEWGVLDRRELAGAKVRLVLCPDPTVIAGQAFEYVCGLLDEGWHWLRHSRRSREGRRQASARPASERARDLLPAEGSGPGRHLVVWAFRHRERDASGHEGCGHRQGACHPGRLPPVPRR
jgi:7,8-dihydropterin-6-yl-methyl-4-(beta-D-ribofuranosyl)aminobenzene 5'-phosphate synthase